MPVSPTTPHPAPATGDAGPAGSGARLPWWGLALPVLGFLVLLTLVADPEGGTGAGVELFTRLAEMAGR